MGEYLDKMTSLLGAFADLVWPPKCAACAARIPLSGAEDGELNSWLCPICAETVMPAQEPWCLKCGLPFESAGPSHTCSACIESPPPFDKARSVFLYGGALADAIQRFKYRGASYLERPLGKALIAYAKGELSSILGNADAVIPMPLHPVRLKARGYNQSALMARRVAVQMRIPLLIGALVRIIDTRNQAGLSRAERIENMHGAFSAKKKARIEGADILLIDDVITSTATAREASKTLLKAGAKRVMVISLARSK